MKTLVESGLELPELLESNCGCIYM